MFPIVCLFRQPLDLDTATTPWSGTHRNRVIVTPRVCFALQRRRDLIPSTTRFHWWPSRNSSVKIGFMLVGDVWMRRRAGALPRTAATATRILVCLPSATPCCTTSPRSGNTFELLGCDDLGELITKLEVNLIGTTWPCSTA